MNNSLLQCPTRIEWIDNLRVLATVSVIALHISGEGAYNLNSTTFFKWNIANIFESLRFCVPAFIMISGSLMLDKTYNIKAYVTSKFTKIVIPFLIFSLLYIIYTYGFKKLYHSFNANEFINFTVQKLIYGSFYHLWFVYMLVGLYAIAPILNYVIKKLIKKQVEYVLLIWLLYNVLDVYFTFTPVGGISFSTFIIFPGYFIMGYYFTVYPLKPEVLKWLLFIAGSLITILGTAFYAYKYSILTEAFYSYKSLNVILQSIGVFSLMQNSQISGSLKKYLRNLISKHSYIIYLIHALVIIFMMKANIVWDFIHPLPGIVACICICLMVSLLISIVLKRLPLIGNYL